MDLRVCFLNYLLGIFHGKKSDSEWDSEGRVFLNCLLPVMERPKIRLKTAGLHSLQELKLARIRIEKKGARLLSNLLR